MKIQILGSGCPNCRRLEQNARDAASGLGLDVEVQKITDVDQIVEMGVLQTPGLAFDDAIQSTGKVLSVDEIETALRAYRA